MGSQICYYSRNNEKTKKMKLDLKVKKRFTKAPIEKVKPLPYEMNLRLLMSSDLKIKLEHMSKNKFK